MSMLGAALKGTVAGLAGTAIMTAYQEAVARSRGSSVVVDSLKEPRTWAEAPTPAQVAKEVSEGLLGKRVTKRQAPLIAKVGHWGYGVSLGAAYGLAASRLGRNPVVQGVAFGAAVWGVANAALTPLGISERPWRTDPRELGLGLSYHLVYGVGAAAIYEALE
jgi:hypothetical protein